MTISNPAVEWRPIDTAPKDGTRILVCSPGSDYNQINIARWGVGEPFGETPAWVTDSEGPGYSTELEGEDEPSHWMPLPALP